MTTTLAIHNLCCHYDDTQVLSQLNLNLKQGEILALLGASGCGKTTLLHAIAGLIPLTEGDISLEGELVSSASHTLPTEKRQLGMIFQDYALFPHLNVADNIGFGLQGWSKAKRKQRVEEMLTLVKLQGLGKRQIHQLSGGQQQRVAIARALAYRPRLLLLDEPFSNIDSQVRHSLIEEIREILKSQQISAIFVTHTKEEAYSFADRLALLHQGKLLQTGTPESIYSTPNSSVVANFLGQANYVTAKVINQAELETELGRITSTDDIEHSVGCEGQLLIRPQQLELNPNANPTPERLGTVKAKRFKGGYTEYQIELGALNLISHSQNSELSLGQPVVVSVKPHPLVLHCNTVNA
ncbi:ABC transporter ATP-binding protein [Ferrimonas aestuarii]|uniref:ABC transporter ATP-binding protein n=1 Tax=Ferrimonas aestuarii TaxID=2569539 RepID=A0A4U1BQR8_9GAMM|nr:ABC transporter ATP-binding protein [Ferrimonas aestuarii]TKB56766.1 ABC transporter ATP-binding protein [Ferrimonas aestuarii]